MHTINALRDLLQTLSRDDLGGILRTAAARRWESPSLYRWLLAASLSELSGDCAEPRLSPVGWPHVELLAATRDVGIWCVICRRPGRSHLHGLFAAVLDVLLAEFSARSFLS